MAVLLYAPEAATFSAWWLLACVPIVMALMRSQDRPSLRRVLAGLCIVFALAAALSADDLVILPTCEACRNVEPWTAAWLACFLSGCF